MSEHEHGELIAKQILAWDERGETSGWIIDHLASLLAREMHKNKRLQAVEAAAERLMDRTVYELACGLYDCDPGSVRNREWINGKLVNELAAVLGFEPQILLEDDDE